MRCFEEALRLNPAHLNAHINLGTALARQGHAEEALARYREALRLNPAWAETYLNMGALYQDRGNLREAVACYRRALEVDPKHAKAHGYLGMVLLLQGDFTAGWGEYEWRRQLSEFPGRSLAQPPWDGEDLDGRTILLYAEQGLGDTLQFIRYAPSSSSAAAG